MEKKNKGKGKGTDSEDFDFIDEVNVTENILNASYYLHVCIMEAIKALGKGIERGSPKDGITLLLISVDQAENIAEAKGIIDKSSEKYKNLLSEYKSTLYDSKEDELIIKAKIANFKLGKLLVEIKVREPKSGNVII